MIAVAIDPDLLAEPVLAAETDLARTRRHPARGARAPRRPAMSSAEPPRTTTSSHPPRGLLAARHREPRHRPRRRRPASPRARLPAAPRPPRPGACAPRSARGHRLEQSARVAGSAGGGDLRLTAAQLAVVRPRFALRKLELPVCAGLELGPCAASVGGAHAHRRPRRSGWPSWPTPACSGSRCRGSPSASARPRRPAAERALARPGPGCPQAAPVAFRGLFAIELRFSLTATGSTAAAHQGSPINAAGPSMIRTLGEGPGSWISRQRCSAGSPCMMHRASSAPPRPLHEPPHARARRRRAARRRASSPTFASSWRPPPGRRGLDGFELDSSPGPQP